MPVPKPRRDDRVEYVVVRRTNVDGEEVADFDSASDPTPTVKALLDRPDLRRQPQSAPTDSEFDADDDDDDDDYPSPTEGPSPILVTITQQPQAQATGGALADNDPTETVVVSISPPPRPPPPHHKGGISQTTEHLLIAAGSIGATIIVVMIILAVYTMRKRGLTLAEAVKHGKYHVTRRGAPPPPPKKLQSNWDQKQDYVDSGYGSMRNDAVTAPQAAASLGRSGSNSSQRPLMALERSDSFNRPSTATSQVPPTQPKSFLLESPPPPRRNNSHRRDDSATPSSPVLPVQDVRRSASTRNTRSIEDDASELRYPDPPQERALSPLPPPPTFKQFLFNRPSISGRPGFGGGMVSRFSWTNSNAPQTPHDPQRDTNSHQLGRDSFMTQRSSVPRFRTIDSWVNQQTNRLEEQKLKEQFRLTQTSTVYSGDDDRDDIPTVPELPKNMDELREMSPPNSAKLAPKPPITPPTPPSGGLPGKNIKHERHDTRTTVETAPIFRQHPGTEVRFSRRSAVPSEILDRGRNPDMLA